MIICRIVDHRVDTFAELFLALFIDHRWQLHILGFLSPLQIAYVGRLLLRNEVQDMLLAQVFQDHIQLLRLQSALTGDETLIDEIIVDKQSTIASQQRGDDLLLVGCGVFQTVEFITTDGKHHTCLVVLFFGIFDIARAVQDLQGRVYLNGEMTESVTELVDIKLESGVIA